MGTSMVNSGRDRNNEIGELTLTLFRVSAHLIEHGNETVRTLGLTAAWWQVLGAIHRAQTPLSVSEIAREMGLMRQSVQRIVNVLIDRGFLARAPNPKHKRAPLVILTDKGQVAVTAAFQRQIPWATKLLDSLGKDRVVAATAMLKELDRLLINALESPVPVVLTAD